MRTFFNLTCVFSHVYSMYNLRKPPNIKTNWRTKYHETLTKYSLFLNFFVLLSGINFWIWAKQQKWNWIGIICQSHNGECLKYPIDNPVSSINTIDPYQVFLERFTYLRTRDSPPPPKKKKKKKKKALRFSCKEFTGNFASQNAC